MRTLTRMLVMTAAAAVMQARGGAGAGRGLWSRWDSASHYTRELAREYEPYMFAAVPLHAPVPVLRVLSPVPLPAPDPRLSRKPRPYATSVRHTSFTRPYAERPYADPGQYAESRPYADVRPYAESTSYDTRQYNEPRPYEATGSRPYVDAVELYETTAPEPGYGRGGTHRPAAASSELAVEWDGLALPLMNVALAAAPSAPEEPLSSAEVSVLYARPSPAGGYLYRKLPNKAQPKKAASSKEQPVIVKIHKHKIIKS